MPDDNPGRVCPTSPEPLPRLRAYQKLDEANGLFWVAVGGNARITDSTPARSPHWLTRIASAESGRTIIVFSIAKNRLAWRTGAILAAAAASVVLGTGAASASTYVTPLGGITVPGDPAGAPAALVASL